MTGKEIVELVEILAWPMVFLTIFGFLMVRLEIRKFKERRAARAK